MANFFCVWLLKFLATSNCEAHAFFSSRLFVLSFVHVVPSRYGHLTETQGEQVLSPALGLLKLALGATRAIKRLLGIDLNLLSQRAAVMAHAAEQV